MSFSSEYKKLNKEQQQAVDHIDGPLLVVAGPGTGKTQLLSLRVANILQKTDADASSILCLTFTNKATANMQDRLKVLIGNEATGIYVRTFHSFAAEVMNRHPEYFWSGARLSIAPDAVQLEIVQQILSRLPAAHPLTLKFAGQFTLIKDVQEAINLTKEAGLSPQKLREIIRANLTYIDKVEPALAQLGELRISTKTISQLTDIVVSLPDQPETATTATFKNLSTIIKESFQTAVEQAVEIGKTTPISVWKRRWIQRIDGEYLLASERKRNEWWLGVGDAYEVYRKEIHSRGYYDYADMLVEVIGQIEEHPSLRAELQEQFQYVLIDEFQDTNAAQLQLAHLVADHFTSEGSPNLMVVGDDDQSIFKFQGAELSNMLDFTRRYPTATIIVLTKNYRSNQEILDSASQIIEHASYRLVDAKPNLSKNLVAASETSRGRIAHLQYPSRPEQLTSVAEEVAKLFAGGQSVAVLARGHASLRDMASVLVHQGVSIRYEQSNNIFDKPGVNQTMLLLRLLVAIGQGNQSLASELLSITLPHPMWQIDPELLWSFTISQSSNQDWYGSLLTHKNKQLHAIGLWLSELLQVSASEPATIVVEYVLGMRSLDSMDSPLKQYFIDQNNVSQEYLETLAALQLFRTLAIEFCSNKQPKISEFVSFANLMEQNGRVLADTTPFQNGERYVELLSIHKAKGLEYDAIAIIDATSDSWSPRSRGRLPPANLPLRPADDDTDDYVRLMYVAATRARRSLLVTSYTQTIKGEDISPTQIIDQLPLVAVPAQTGTILQQTLEATFAWPRLKQSDEKQLLKSWLENYSMSVTHLINFLDVGAGGPQHFFERNVLRLPAAKSPAAALGTAVHDSLQLAQNLTNQTTLSLSKIKEQLKLSLKLQGLPHADYVKQLARGEHILSHLFEKLGFELQTGAKPEYVIKNISCGAATLNGTLDVLLQTETSTLITDYKTGRPLTSLRAAAGDEGVKAWKHRLQLIYYALLAELSPHLPSHQDIVCQMLYVEAQTKKELVKQYSPSPDEITRLSSLIQVVWTHVMNLDFPSVSGYSPDYQGITNFEQDLLSGKI